MCRVVNDNNNQVNNDQVFEKFCDTILADEKIFIMEQEMYLLFLKYTIQYSEIFDVAFMINDCGEVTNEFKECIAVFLDGRGIEKEEGITQDGIQYAFKRTTLPYY
jgi:hypothetical protein